MRFKAPTLAACTVFCTVLLATSASAAPQNQQVYAPSSSTTPSATSIGTDDMERMLAERNLLSHIDNVRQNVSTKASEIVVTAMGFLGVPYRRGGNSAETGFDCSGFVRAIYEQSLGMVLPRRAEQQAAATENIDKSDLQPGDLVFFNTMRRTFSHVGMYVGDGKFIHSPRSGAEVRVESLSVAYWKRRFDGARRVARPADAGAAQASLQQRLTSAAMQIQAEQESLYRH
ncbi:MAG: peptidoglycan endopeptidase [Comamonadaceae bacterium]|nr:MAG: peptidoglycan endopeptidase [Comamonadaceae bacterium]